MAAIPRRSPLRQARVRRLKLPQYLRLDGGRYLIAAALLLALMSLLALGQTGRLATKGYEIGQLQARRTELLREMSATRLRLSEAQSLTRVEQRVKELNLRPAEAEQLRFITIPAESDQTKAADERQSSP